MEAGGPRSGLTRRRVTTKAELRGFIDLTASIASARGESDHVVPLVASDITAWASGSGWFAEEVELWLLTDDSGAAVGRVLCHRSRLLAERLSDGPGAQAPETLFFGALEALDAAVIEEIIALVLDRADALGACRVFGPVSPLPNVTGGLVTAGFEHPGFFDTAWNPEFIAEAFAAAGFSTWGPAQTWEVRLDAVPRARATAVSPAEWSEHGLRRRPVTRLGMRGFAARLLPTLNAAFSALPYFTQISPAQLRSQMAGLSVLADPSLIVDVVGAEEGDDAPSRCFALVVPDPVPVLRRHGGRLGPAALWDLLRHRSRLTDAVLIIQGTDPRFQGQGLLSLVTREVYAGLVAGGYRRLRVTFIAEDNPASAAVFAKAGGTPLHSLCFLDRRLESAPEGTDLVVERPAADASDTAATDDADTTGSDASDVEGADASDTIRTGASVTAATGTSVTAGSGTSVTAGPGPQSSPGISARLLTSLFRTAGRAPSAHNTQPWMPTVAGIAEDGAVAEVGLTVDPDRTLPAGDPRSEDLHLSLGCWIEAFAIAAAEADLAVDVTSVDGWGPGLTVGLDVRSGAGRPGGSDSPVAAWPSFTVADLEHRQVDRGPLARDEAALDSAVETANIALAQSGARLVEVTDGLWARLLDRAEHWSFSTPAVFTETLAWLRFDPRDPAYREDGLTAECLRIPSFGARAAALLNRAPLRPFIARAVSGALAPIAWFTRRPQGPAAETPPRRTGAPHHLILAAAEAAEDTEVADDGTPAANPTTIASAVADSGQADSASAARADTVPADTAPADVKAMADVAGMAAVRELRLGRDLLRTWLLFDRAGLRVDVHSEIKDCPEAHASLRDLLGRQKCAGSETLPDGSARFTRPIAAFSVGRSTTRVPRSHRRSDA